MANTRRIRTFGTRVPFMRRRSGFRRARFPWVFGTFRVSHSIGTGVNRFELASWDDYDDPDTVPLNEPLRLHRVQFKSAVILEPVAAAGNPSPLTLAYALWQEDKDETDAEMWGTTDNLLSQKQILHWGLVHTFASGNTIAASLPFDRQGVMQINFDLRMRKPIRVPPDGRLVLGTQWAQDPSSSVDGALLNGMVRVVAQRQGVGR